MRQTQKSNAWKGVDIGGRLGLRVEEASLMKIERFHFHPCPENRYGFGFYDLQCGDGSKGNRPRIVPIHTAEDRDRIQEILTGLGRSSGYVVTNTRCTQPKPINPESLNRQIARGMKALSLSLYDTYLGLIWVYQLISMPLIIWVVRGYFEDISVEIEHAAQVDGYSWWQIFFKILVPLIRPGLVASALLCFIFAWNSFTFPLLLAGIKIEPITVAATKYLAQNTVHYGQMAVAATFSALPSIIFAICIQKHLVRGLSFGAVKG